MLKQSNNKVNELNVAYFNLFFHIKKFFCIKKTFTNEKKDIFHFKSVFYLRVFICGTKHKNKPH